METIILKALEGGWKARDVPDARFRKRLVSATEFYYTESHEAGFWMTDFETVCDPLFWQALGKSCGWEGKVEVMETWKKMPDFILEREVKVGEVNTWNYHALRFHEINLTEGWESAVKYLEGIIN